MATETAPAEELSGLTEDEARRRLAARGKPPKPPTSRSYWTIVRGNTFTLPNILLGVLGIATLALGQTADALFLGVVIANVVIGSVQEIRAKRALDRLAALVRPEARVIRGGTERTIAAGEVVVGDLVALQPGDQVVADGTLATSDGLRLDESMLTGESDPVVKSPGAQVLSGAFAVEGVGRFEVTAVGQDSYAEQLTGQARTFRHPTSPFQRGLGRLILTLVTLGVPLVLALSIAEWLRGSSFEDGFSAVVAGAIVLIPEGLILLASIVYVTGALKMSRHGALVQQLNAVESLASANVVCTDKTGTLTEPRLRVVSVVPAAADEQELRHAFGRYAASSEVRNSTLEALAEAFPAPVETPSASIPFSSRWKWSAVELADGGLVLGAPELFPLGSVADAAGSEAASGRRVVAIASTSEDLSGIDPAAGVPGDLRVLGLATLSEELRPNTRETVAYFQEQEIALKVLSGDAPSTVATIANDAGIAGVGTPANGADLPAGEEELQALLRETAVVGRISPEGKKRIIEALRDDGRYVGMIGDGVNDVPALKASRVAIAQGSGAQMARTVADLVLVRGDFAAVPRMVAEGRQILRNMQRVSKLFTTKCLFGAFIVLGLGLAPIDYPFLPRHLTLAGFFLTGIPTFVLALAPSEGPWQLQSYARSVFRFAIPAAFAIALGTALSYVLALEVVGIDLEGSRTVALAAFVMAFLYVIFALEATDRRRALWVAGLCGVLGIAFWVSLAVPLAQDIFDVVFPDAQALGLVALGFAVSVAVLTLVRIRPGRRYE